MANFKVFSIMTRDTALMLAHYSDWADRTLFAALSDLPEGTVDKSTRTLFGSILGTLNHNFQVDLIWRAHLLGESHGFSSRRDILHPTIGRLMDAQYEINRWYVDWAGRQDSESLARKLKFIFVSGEPGEMTAGGMLLHVTNHKTYHRGWVSQMFFDFDMKPPETDICVFMCERP